MTKRKHPAELQRPRRPLGELMRGTTVCPLCHSDVRVVAYRAKTARLECERCGLRFSLEPWELARCLLGEGAQAMVDNSARNFTMEYMLGALAGGHTGVGEDRTNEDYKEAVTGFFRDIGYRMIHACLGKPGQSPDQRVAASEALNDRIVAAARQATE